MLRHSKILVPGFLEADTVAHCGNSLAGEFVYTVTLTDIYSGWTENRACWTKKAKEVLKQVRRIEANLPFFITGFACDNGSEFLNEDFYKYFSKRQAPIHFVRRRPYQKNDNCYVEQKNYTHVRKLLGYDRLEDKHLIGLINDIYKNYFNPLRNYFIATQKLESKQRIGSKIKKKYDKPQTPCDRLLDCSYVSEDSKRRLRQERESLNPIVLNAELKKKLKKLLDYVDNKHNLAWKKAGNDS